MQNWIDSQVLLNILKEAGIIFNENQQLIGNYFYDKKLENNYSLSKKDIGDIIYLLNFALLIKSMNVVNLTKEELLEFIGRLDKKSMETIFEFLDQMPTVTWRKEITCPGCGTKSTVEYKGLDDFLN